MLKLLIYERDKSLQYYLQILMIIGGGCGIKNMISVGIVAKTFCFDRQCPSSRHNWSLGRGAGRAAAKIHPPTFAEGFDPLQIYDGNKMLSSRHFQWRH